MHGFEAAIESGQTNKQQIRFGIIMGTVLLFVLLIIGLFVECPTQNQNRIFTTVLALAAAAFSAAIPGFIKVQYKKAITATGAIAVFVIVFIFRPAELSDFRSCLDSISGTVYINGRPSSLVEVDLFKLSQSTETNASGYFSLPVNLSAVEDGLQIQFRNSESGIDTIIVIEKSELKKSLDIYLTY